METEVIQEKDWSEVTLRELQEHYLSGGYAEIDGDRKKVVIFSPLVIKETPRTARKRARAAGRW